MTGEVAAIERTGGRATGVRLADGTRIAAGTVVVTAGTGTPRARSRRSASALPVEARKRYVFTFACRETLAGFPLLIDPSGVYVRPEGDVYICGALAAAGATIRRRPTSRSTMPSSRRRSGRCSPPASRRSRRSGRAAPGPATTTSTLFDQNAIVGPLPGLANLLVATGFSGHGLQQAPAVGRGLAELIVHGRYTSLDLTPLGYERIAEDEPLGRGERRLKRKRAPERRPFDIHWTR